MTTQVNWGVKRDTWFATALYAAITLLLAYPLSFNPGSTSMGSDADVHTFTWTLAWGAHALFHDPLSIFDANIFFPYHRTLAYSENLIGSAFIAAPVLWLTDNTVLAMNVVSLVSCVLCGVGAYLLGRQIGLSPAAALVCGLIFAFSPARFFRFGQTHLTTIQWMPFALTWLHKYLERGEKRDLRIALGFFTLQALTSGHGFVYLLIASGGLVVYRLLLGEPLAVTRRLRDIGVSGAFLLLPVVLLLPPYLRVQKEMGLVRTLENWAAAPESFLASPTHVHAWLNSRLWDSPINERASAFLFPGYVTVLLVAVALVTLRSQPLRRDAIYFALVALAGALLSMGPPLGLWPLVYWLPGLNFIRIPSRFFLLAMLGIAVLAGIGFQWVTDRLAAKHRLPVAVAAAILLVAEFSWIPLPVTPYRVELPAIDRWLDTQPKPFAVAELPVGPSVRYHSTYMLHSMAHWQKTVHGHSSLLPPSHERLYDQLRNFPDAGVLPSLAKLGVDYIVVHTDMYEPAKWAATEKRLESLGSWLTLEHVEGAGRVYRLNPKGAAED